VNSEKQPALTAWTARVGERPAVMRDNADVLGTMQRLQAEGRQAFDPYRVQWRSDRLEWVIKNGFADRPDTDCDHVLRHLLAESSRRWAM
jgi:hypothetical protein